VHHGTADLTVPIQSSIDFATTNPGLVRLTQVEGAEHVGSYDVLGEHYINEVLEYIASLE
jgi:hypothetical protein